MKYFKHDLGSRDNDKIFELIEAHGMQGYGIWWAIVEELYKAEANGFFIEATETWFKRLSKSLCLTDWRTLIRILDTMAEQGLISPQLWADHVIQAPGIAERADDYMRQKELAAQRKRNQRDRDRHARVVASRVTPAGQSVSHAGVATNTDPDPDPNSDSEKERTPLTPPVGGECARPQDFENSAPEPEPADTPPPVEGQADSPATQQGGLRDKKVPRRRKPKNAAATYEMLSDRSGFESFWEWYRTRVCSVRAQGREGLAAEEGSKAEAAWAWVRLEDSDYLGRGRDGFRDGCRLQFEKYAKTGGLGIPHACRFLLPSTGEPPWLLRLQERDSPAVVDEFMPGMPPPSVPAAHKTRAQQIEENNRRVGEEWLREQGITPKSGGEAIDVEVSYA